MTPSYNLTVTVMSSQNWHADHDCQDLKISKRFAKLRQSWKIEAIANVTDVASACWDGWEIGCQPHSLHPLGSQATLNAVVLSKA